MIPTILIAITSIFLHGRIIDPNEEFTCDLPHAKKLVDGGSAKFKDSKEPTTLFMQVNTGENGENADESPENTVENGGISGGNTEIPSDNSVDLAEKLDGLTIVKLKELTQKHKIQLKSDDNKPEIIEKIIAAGVELDEKDI